jgi:hypothetical protein
MIENEVIVTTQYGNMPTFAACPEGPGSVGWGRVGRTR